MTPPLIANPTQTVMKDGRKLMYFTNGGKLRFVLPTKLGHVELVDGVAEADIVAVIEAGRA